MNALPGEHDESHDESHDQNHDQDSEPPTPDGKEPDTTPSQLDDEPASDPDPAPGD